MKSVFIKTLISAIIFLCALILTSIHANAEDIYLVIPSHQISDTQTLESIAQSAWDEAGRDDGLTVISIESAETIMTVRFPDKGRYDREKYKSADFGNEYTALKTYASKADEKPAPEILEWRSDIPEVLDRIADLRAGSNETGRVLIVGTPLHHVSYNTSLSMVTEDGEIRVVSDGFTAASRMLSPYGLPENKSGLNGLAFDFCAVMPDISSHEVSEVGRQWYHIIAQQKGRLGSFTSDVQTCLKRFKARTDDPLSFRRLNPDVDPAMIAADMSSEAQQVTIKSMSDLSEAQKEAQDQIDILLKKLTDAKAELERLKRERDAAKQELDKIKEALGQTPNSEVVDFSKFTYQPHPSIDDLTISTGVGYEDGFPDHYVSSWCYFHKLNAAGAKIRFEVGTKSSGKAIEWQTANTAILKDVDLTQRDFKAARTSCRFPKT